MLRAKKPKKRRVPTEIMDFAIANACRMVRIKDSGELKRCVGFNHYGVVLEDLSLGAVFKDKIKHGTKWPLYQESNQIWWLSCSARFGATYLLSQLEQNE